MLMPAPDKTTLSRRGEICTALKAMLPAGCVIDDDATMRAYDADGLSSYRQMPLVVVLPETTEQVAEVLRWCRDNDVKVVPRGCWYISFRRRAAACRWCIAGIG